MYGFMQDVNRKHNLQLKVTPPPKKTNNSSSPRHQQSKPADLL